MELTENFVAQISPPQPGPDGKGSQSFYRDSKLVGFALRVSSGGTKSYIIERRIRGKVKRITIGRCDKLSFDKAQSRAKKLIREIEKENAPRIIYGKVTDENISLLTAYYEYLQSHDELNQTTKADYQRSMDGPLHDWQSLAVTEITSSMVIEKHKSYSGTHPARCNNAMRLLRAVLNYVQWKMITTEHQPILTRNPVDIIEQRQLWHPHEQEKSASHGLSDSEIKTWWLASQNIKKESSRLFLRALLCTGYSPKTLSEMKYSAIDRDQFLCKTSSESGVRLPIPELMARYIYRVTNTGFIPPEFIFTGLTKDKPISDIRTSLKRIENLCGIKSSPRILHATFRRLMSETTSDPEINKIMNKVYKGINAGLSQDTINKVRKLQDSIYEKIQGMI